MRQSQTVLCVFAVAISACLATNTRAQQASANSDPATTLTDALSAACRLDQNQFATFFTADNGAAYRALPDAQRQSLLKRFSLSDDPGKPLRSADQNNRTVLRCQTPGSITEFRFGATRMDGDDLAFIPISVMNSQSADFGMIREKGSWKLLSLGLVLLDIHQLSGQWAAEDTATQEAEAVASLQKLAEAIDAYKKTFGKLPDTLVEIGPAGKESTPAGETPFISTALASGNEGGYKFLYRIAKTPNSSDSQYELDATPENYPTTGHESFFRDRSGKIHAADKHGGVAESTDALWRDEKTQ